MPVRARWLRSSSRVVLAACMGLGGAWLPRLVLAQTGPDAASEGLLAEPIVYTDVIDAFEEGDPIDVNVGLRFVRRDESATIAREVIDAASSDGRSTRHYVDVATHEWSSNELALELEIGLYHDLMATFRLPIVLGEEQELRPLSSSACNVSVDEPSCRALLEPDGSSILDLSSVIASRRRSGLPNIELGLSWAVLNQYRSAELPTWLLGLSTALETGAPRTACTGAMECEPGISHGTSTLTLETRVSRRSRYVEPYLGLGHTFAWVAGGDALFYGSGDREHAVDAEPASKTTGVLGSAIMPWEDRARHQRFEIDLQGRATSVSTGQGFSPLFDALGTSSSAYLNGATRGAAAFSGMTHVEAHATLGLDLTLVLQAARYVRFTLGAGLAATTPHLITGSPPCNSSIQPRAGDPRVGNCARGVVNPLHRTVIDTPGQRFRSQAALLLQLQAGATGRF